MTLCNNSPVDYPRVGVVFVLTQCSCAIYPSGLPRGTADRFDPTTGRWIPLGHPVITTGADYLGGFSDVRELPKGKQVTLKYRVALDASMADGMGAVQATVVVPDDLVQIGRANLPFTVSRQSTTHSKAPAPRPTALPFTGLTDPRSVSVDAIGNVYLADTRNDRVLMLEAGANEQTVLPFSGLESPGSVTVDSAGNVYVTDRNRVVKLAAGSADQTVLPLTGLEDPEGLAVNAAGDLYVIDGENSQVVKFAAGSNGPTAVPSTLLYGPEDVAVDGVGNVYVVDNSGFGQVVKLGARS